MNNSVIDEYIRIITLGASGVGKTNIIKVFTGKDFNDIFINTLGLDCKKKVIEKTIDTKPVTLTVDIFDTAGQEKFKSLNKNYYNKKHGAILVFNLTDKTSLDALDYWLTEIRGVVKNPSDYPYLLLGNQHDKTKDIQVSKEEVDAFKQKHNLKCHYYEVSAKIGADKINEVITEFCMYIYIKMQNNQLYFPINAEMNKPQKQINKAKCC